VHAIGPGSARRYLSWTVLPELRGTLMMVGRSVVIALSIAASACGRVGFDSSPAGSTIGDGGADGADARDAGNGDALAPMAAEGPSCAGLASTCGATGAESCCQSPLVPGGTYYRSYDAATGGTQANPATVSSFWLDRYEITVGRFRNFVNAGFGTQANPPLAGAAAHPAIPGSGWDASWNANLAIDTATLIATIKCDATYQTWTDTPGGNEDRPMNCLSWYDVMAFCAWDGGRLPTEAEWNYAAAGGDEQRAYPWSVPPSSTVIDSSYASYWVDATQGCVGDGVAGCAMTDMVFVGSKPAGNGRWGHADLSGNMGEFMLDTYNAYQNPCTDCAYLTSSGSRVVRGASMFDPASYVRSGFRTLTAPTTRSANSGSRCARSP
jgi:formylglycine-generating enzyme required for sulfatase activity